MKLETIAITKLTPDPENARQHDETNLKAIEGSLREFGQRKPIVISQTNVIVAGNGTVEAAKRLGWTDIQAVRVPADWDANRIKAFALADNRTAELAEWSPQVLAEQLLEIEQAGFDIEAFGFEKVEPLEDRSKEENGILPEQVETRVKLGQLWQLGNHRLLCGDSFDESAIDRLLDNQFPDMVFTDPPYGMNLNADYSKMLNTKNGAAGKKHSQVIGDNQEFDPSLILRKFDKCEEIMLWGYDYYANKLPQGTPLVWDKRVEDKYDSVIGSSFELLWSKKKRRRQIIRYNYTSWGSRMADSLDGSKPHPTMKPVDMTIDVLKLTQSKTILDLFGGSGSTLIACERIDRTCFMMELDPKYCDVIIQRWENLTGKKAELVNG